VALSWDDIDIVNLFKFIIIIIINFKVIYNSSLVNSCPICMEKSLIAPKITRCGHIMCWPCLERLNNYWQLNNTKGKKLTCPLCQVPINLTEVKFCEVWNGNVNPYHEGELITFHLLMKENKTPTLYNTHKDHDLR